MTRDTAGRVLDRVHALGVILWADDGRLCFDAPVGTITSNLRQDLGRYKPELLALLSAPAVDPIDDPEAASSERVGHWLAGVENPALREHLLYVYGERAAICEVDGLMSRTDAEAEAYREVRAMLPWSIRVKLDNIPRLHVNEDHIQQRKDRV